MGKVDPMQRESRRVVEHSVDSTVGARIRSLREDAGMTQGELAARVFVSRQTVINW